MPHLGSPGHYLVRIHYCNFTVTPPEQVFVVTDMSNPPWSVHEMECHDMIAPNMVPAYFCDFQNVPAGLYQYKIRVGEDLWVVDYSKGTTTLEDGTINNVIRVPDSTHEFSQGHSVQIDLQNWGSAPQGSAPPPQHRVMIHPNTAFRTEAPEQAAGMLSPSNEVPNHIINNDTSNELESAVALPGEVQTEVSDNSSSELSVSDTSENDEPLFPHEMGPTESHTRASSSADQNEGGYNIVQFDTTGESPMRRASAIVVTRTNSARTPSPRESGSSPSFQGTPLRPVQEDPTEGNYHVPDDQFTHAEAMGRGQYSGNPIPGGSHQPNLTCSNFQDSGRVGNDMFTPLNTPNREASPQLPATAAHGRPSTSESMRISLAPPVSHQPVAGEPVNQKQMQFEMQHEEPSGPVCAKCREPLLDDDKWYDCFYHAWCFICCNTGHHRTTRIAVAVALVAWMIAEYYNYQG